MSKDNELEIIQEYLDSVSGNVLLCSNDSTVPNLLSNHNVQLLSNVDQPISDYVDTLLLTNTLEDNILKEDKKFDTIIIHDLFEQVKNPELFIRHLDSVLNDNGTIICSISNFSHINNILNLLIGNVDDNFFNASRFYDLNNFLLFLNENNVHTTRLSRIKQEFSSESMNLDDTLIPLQLIEMYQKIPDHDVAQYIFMIGKGKSVSSESLNFSSQFPKNYLLPKLQEFFEKFTEFESSISKKDIIIHGYEESIKEQKDYTKSALIEQKDYTELALSEKDIIIHGHENSIKEQKDYTELALSEKDIIIHGHENSIKEQQNYIKNLEEHIHLLESQLKKFKFWKR